VMAWCIFSPFSTCLSGRGGFLQYVVVFSGLPPRLSQRLFSGLNLKKDKKDNDSFKKYPIATKRETLNEWKMEKHNREEGCGESILGSSYEKKLG